MGVFSIKPIDSLFPACDSSLGKCYLLTLVPQAQSCWFSASWWPTCVAGPHHPATHPNHPRASFSPLGSLTFHSQLLPGFDYHSSPAFSLYSQEPRPSSPHTGTVTTARKIFLRHSNMSLSAENLAEVPRGLLN